MSDKTAEQQGIRRGLLKALGLGGAALAAVPAAGAFEIGAGPAPRGEKENNAEKRATRYRETDDVKAYYRTNRY